MRRSGSPAVRPPTRARSSELLALVVPLRIIFWGALLAVLPIPRTPHFDCFNDVVGMVIATAGIFCLAATPLARPHAGAMIFVECAAILSVVSALASRLQSSPAVVLSIGMALVQVAALLVFLTRMQRICGTAGLHRAAASWRTNMILSIFTYVLSTLVFLAVATGVLTKVTPATGILLLLVLATSLGVLIHFFVCTSRTVHDARGAATVRQVRERIALRDRLRTPQ